MPVPDAPAGGESHYRSGRRRDILGRGRRPNKSEELDGQTHRFV